MDASTEVGYNPPPDFQEVVQDPIIELDLTESTELWLIQCPINQFPTIDGQKVSLKLHVDGQLGSFEDSSGKAYDMVSFAAQDTDAAVFLSSGSGSEIVGKISRRVSFVHYPDADELLKKDSGSLEQMHQRFSVTPQSNRRIRSRSGNGNPASTYSSRHRSSISLAQEALTPPRRKHADKPTRSIDQSAQAASHSSRHLSSLSEAREPSNPSKGRHADKPTRSIDDQSAQDSGRGHSGIFSSGSLELSQENKSNKKKIDG